MEELRKKYEAAKAAHKKADHLNSYSESYPEDLYKVANDRRKTAREFKDALTQLDQRINHEGQDLQKFGGWAPKQIYRDVSWEYDDLNPHYYSPEVVITGNKETPVSPVNNNYNPFEGFYNVLEGGALPIKTYTNLPVNDPDLFIGNEEDTRWNAYNGLASEVIDVNDINNQFLIDRSKNLEFLKRVSEIERSNLGRNDPFYYSPAYDEITLDSRAGYLPHNSRLIKPDLKFRIKSKTLNNFNDFVND